MMDDLIVKFIDSTNDYMVMTYGGSEGTLAIGDTANLTHNGRLIFRTSLLESAEMEGDELVLKTLNSVYRFKVLSGKLKPEHLTRIDNNKDLAEQYKVLNENEKSTLFVCTVGGSPLIDGARSLVRLPYAMNRMEALEYLKEHVLVSLSGDIVVYINQPVSEE